MSDLRPKAVGVKLGEQERNLLFTINSIDEIQTTLNMPLIDAMKFVARAADGRMDHDTLISFRAVTTILLNCNSTEELTEKEVGGLITLENYRHVAWSVMEAYGISLPDPDEDEEFEEDDEEIDPNVETGQ